MIKDNFGKIYKKGFTHGGDFHADEVLSTALLKLIDEDFEVERQVFRTDSIPTNEDILVFDIGRGKYDHHMNVGEGLFDGDHKHAACGLVLRDFYEGMGIDEEIYKKLKNGLIREVEDVDNGVEETKSLYSSIVSSFIPSETELSGLSENEKIQFNNERFFEAVEWSKLFIEKTISRIKNNIFFGEYTNNQANLLERKETLEICRDELRKMLNCKGTSLNEIVSNSSCFEDDIKEKLIKRFTKFEEEKDAFDIFTGLDDNITRKGISSYFKKILTSAIEIAPYEEMLREDFNNMEKGSSYLIISEPGEWGEFVINQLNEIEGANIDFVVFYGDKSKYWMVQCVPPDMDHHFSQRVSLPEEIRGKSNQGEVTAVEDAKVLDSFSPNIVFCHPAGFLAGTRDLESAIALIEKTKELENNKKMDLAD